MKSIFTKISSALLAFLVLFSTLSFTVESHYCGGFLMDISVVGEANDCGMKVEQKMAKEKINCCKDEVIITDGQDELHPASFGTLNFEKQQFLTTFYSSYLNLPKEESSRNIIYKAFHRPVIPINYQIKYQSFLI
ncbi:hypothetical protein [uncultured Polaribacter sp.]|jgi:hypothetical protein|uniref:HYC_CC_PP family protein n=1 Tax=uncultured Polaribacter sp. TaxID=174711 RepID=UPI0030DA023A